MTTTRGSSAVVRRLRPLQIALLLEGIAPWVPVEKIFMTQLGFTPALFGTMAAAYAATVPLLEIPSGILADRWSRRGVLMLAGIAALASVVVGGLSRNVGTYIASAMLLGVYFALQSGTVDAIVYDTLTEEHGHADDFEKRFGRIQLLNSAALTISALAGGAIAAIASPRLTYFITVPTAIAGLIVLSRFREPTLHRSQGTPRVRAQLSATWRTITRQHRVAPIAIAMMLGAAATQMMFEFGPLWLVAAAVPTVVFGPYTAGMTSTLGLGGLLAGRLPLGRVRVAVAAAATMAACGLVLALTSTAWILITAQIVLVVSLVTIGIHLSQLLHQLVPSATRSSVSSGIGTLSWLTFLPCSLLFGALSGHGGIRVAGWVVTFAVGVAGAMLVQVSRRTEPREARETRPSTTESARTGRCRDNHQTSRPNDSTSRPSDPASSASATALDNVPVAAMASATP
jgi:MFS family permease